MANITEKDIIAHLQEKIKFHQNEAKRLEAIMSAFKTDTGLQLKTKEKPAVAATTPSAKEAVKEIRKSPAKPRAEVPAKALEIPAKYTDDLPVSAKIAFALNEITAGFNEDIANAMAQYEPKSDAKKISKQISGVLSTLKNKGQLQAEKAGRKDRFSLVAR